MNNDQIKKRIILAVQRILDDALPSEGGDRTDEAAADQWNMDAATQQAYDELKTELSGLWKTDSRRVG
ncbi:hypothetical protein IFO70_33355 [Phormidium tenue FACHB-886]|nr:hypothetical protein [Phormidium tenue FACHB-886]